MRPREGARPSSRPEVQALVGEMLTGLVSDEQFIERADQIAATDEELAEALQTEET